MKSYSFIWLILFSLLTTACKSNDEPTTGFDVFSKKVDVFGVVVYATADTPDDKVLHAAAVLAEYLDNDEDGVPDNQNVVNEMVSRNASLVMFKDEDAEARRHFFVGGWHEGRAVQDLYGAETHPNGAARGIFDASLEEVLHLVTFGGYAYAYPDVFGERSGTAVAKALDLARGGHFEEVPDRYPENAWFTYYDETCDYSCQITEYMYWALTSILGAQDFPGRLERIQEEWRLNTREKVMTGDPAIYTLLTDPQYKFATVLPDGNYTGGAIEIQKF